MAMQTITISLKSGLVQDVEGIPDNVKVRVLDFDVDGADVNRLIRLPDNSKALEKIWTNQRGSISQQNGSDEKLSQLIPATCPECGCQRDSYECRGLQYTLTDIESVDDENNIIIPSELDMTDWSISPVLVYCGECGVLLLDRRLKVANAISIWDQG
jgi:hypothetical protein